MHNKNNRILLQSSQTITKLLAIKFYLVYREPFPLNVGPSSYHMDIPSSQTYSVLTIHEETLYSNVLYLP